MKNMLVSTLLLVLLLAPTSCSKKREKFVFSDYQLILKDTAKITKFADITMDTVRKYEVSWAGMHIGNLIAEVKPLDDSLRFKVIINSYGIASFISGYKSDTTSIINHDEEIYMPSTYITSFHMRDKKRDISLFYNENGKTIDKEYNSPPEKRWKRKAVRDGLKFNTFDPLTLVLTARKKIIELFNIGKKTGEFSLPLYDGRRRTNFLFSLHGKDDEGLLHVSFKEEAIAGYTDNELVKLKERDSTIHLYLHPKDFFPVKAKGQSPLGTAHIFLTQVCSTLKECLG